MSKTQYQIRPGAYYDSVVLMQLQKALVALEGVEDAGVVMATPANRELLEAAGFSVSEIEAAADDLLIVVRAEDEEIARASLERVDELLQQRRTESAEDYRPHSLRAAVRQLPEAEWVLVSVPGRYAAGVAQEALSRGKHVFLYSDNVPLEEEVRLKEISRAAGLLVMGPDCGTAMINGVGLGFANRVRRGKIGVVAAAGTGMQAVTATIHNLGQGISQAIGTGGRDLKEEVGGATALQGLDLLARDPQTEMIVLVSKPPAPTVVTRLLAAAQATGKPVVVNFLGYPPPGRSMGNLHFATSLNEAATLACSLLQREEGARAKEAPLPDKEPASEAPAVTTSPSAPSTPTDVPNDQPCYLRGLFSGGTLAYEALLTLQNTLTPLYSNIPLRPEQQLPQLQQSQKHTILDLGEDEFTQGRLHPMIDNDLRLRRLRQEATDPEAGLILLDVVLGEGAHPDPASELAPAIAALRQARPALSVAVLLLGTDEDPQNREHQSEQLAQAGAVIFHELGRALDYASSQLHSSSSLQPPSTPVALAPFASSSLAAINIGLESFYDSLRQQGASALQMDWRPPAGGNEKMMALLAQLKGP